MIKQGLCAIAVLAAACGGGDKKAAPGGGSAAGSAGGAGGAAEAPLPALGVDALKKMNYQYGAGQKEYAKVVEAYKAKTRDWAAVKAAAEATIAKDADHLDAHWALGEALAQGGDGKGATAELTKALAGDWLKWGPNLAGDPDLAGYLATADGKALVALSERMKSAVIDALAKQPLILGRRSTWKAPKVGTGYAATRGELYAYDATGKRYLRVTHTDHTLAAVLPSASGELLLVGFTEAEVPDPAKRPTAPPLVSKSWVSAWSPKDLTETAARAKIGKARFVWAGWGAGDQIVVKTATASGRWSAGAFTAYVVDRTTGKLTKSASATAEGPTVQLSMDEVIDGVRPTWPAELPPEVADKLSAAVDVDERGAPALAAVARSPSQARIAFASATDPCAKADDAAKPSLYVADAKTGAYKHVLTAASRFGLRWLDDDHLLYEDGTGSLRIYDAAAGRETGKFGERAGLAIARLSPSAAPLCTTDPVPEPAAFDPAEEGSDYDPDLDDPEAIQQRLDEPAPAATP